MKVESKNQKKKKKDTQLKRQGASLTATGKEHAGKQAVENTANDSQKVKELKERTEPEN